MLKIPQNIEKIINTLIKNGYEAYVVGGAVRDSLRGNSPDDFDITTSCPAETVIELFEKTIPTGLKHGTVTVIENSIPTEVTTFRIDGQYNNHRSPESVEFTRSLEEDLKRRDFTINAMAFNKINGIIDIFGGKEDLKNQIIKTVGNPEERFKEDALRILRGIRFAATLNFEIQEKTYKAMINNSHLLNSVSGERIYTELTKALSGENLLILEDFINKGGLSFLKITKAHDFKKISNLSNNLNLRILAFLLLSNASFEDLSKTLKFNNKLKNNLESLIFINENLKTENKKEIKEILNHTSPEIFSEYIFFIKYFHLRDTKNLELIFNEIINNKEPYKISMLNISGNDLLDLGFNGEEIGEKLNYLLEICITEPKYNSKEKLLEIIKN